MRAFEENIFSLINFVALPEDVNALYSFSSEIFDLSILVQQKSILGEPLYIVFPPL